MRIALVSEHASPLAAIGGVDAGGQNVYVAALASALARAGAEVVVHTRRDDPWLPRHVSIGDGVTVEHVDAGPARPVPKDELLPLMGTFARSLRTSWKNRPVDAVHAQFWMSGMAALEAARPLGIPVAQTFHALGVVKRREQGDHDTSPPERLATEARIARCADRIIATCSDERFELARMGADPHRVSVVPCGVDLGRFRPDGPVAPRRAGLQRLVVVSRLVRRKGIGNVISAMARLPGAELVVAGGPRSEDLPADPEATRLAVLARRLGVTDRVRLLGQVAHDELPALLRSADAVVCTPWYEPFGMVAVEAMACGVPVVATAVGGLIDTVIDGVTGLHVTPRDGRELTATLEALLADPQRRAALGRAGAQRARQHYGWDRIAARALELYAQMAADAGQRAVGAHNVPAGRVARGADGGGKPATGRVGGTVASLGFPAPVRPYAAPRSRHGAT
jgi:glycosyltransferase involved in cell wall biosynthesis